MSFVFLKGFAAIALAMRSLAISLVCADRA
jgi:hypothetical protein